MNAVVKIESRTMTSQEIANLVEKRHDNVKRTIESLVNSGVISKPQIEDGIKSANGVVPQVYKFSGEQGKRDSIIIVAQLCPEFTARLVDRWQELEEATRHKDKKQTQLGSVTRQCAMMARAFGFKGNQHILATDKAVRALTGQSPLELMGETHLIAANKEKIFTPTQLGGMLEPPISARKVNEVLEHLGYQCKVNGEWVVTSKGEKLCEMLDTGKKRGNGVPVKQIKWYQTVLDILKESFQKAA